MAKKLISGAEFWDFDKYPTFIGILGDTVKREKDGKGENQKAGDIMGYNFTDKDGEVHLIGNSHAIEKAVNMVGSGAILKIQFLGKTKNANGQNVNRFSIDQLDDENEMNTEVEKLFSGK